MTNAIQTKEQVVLSVLGSAPTVEQLEGKNILERFIYEYEFFFKSILMTEMWERPLIEVLQKGVDSVPYFPKLEKEQQWWVIYLVTVHIYTDNAQRSFLGEYLREKLMGSPNLSAKEWQDIAESAYTLMRKSGLDAPLARPAVIVGRNSRISESMPQAKFWFPLLEEGAKFFKGNVRIKDIQTDYLNLYGFEDMTNTKKFSTTWLVLSELYVRHLLTQSSSPEIREVASDSQMLLDTLCDSSVEFFLNLTTYDEETCGKLAEKAMRKFKLIE